MVDDETGTIAYFAAAVDAPTAARWMERLVEVVPWRRERRRMYDRDVDVPRLVAAYRLGDPAAQPPPEVAEAALRGTQLGGAPFNSIGLNLYRDGRDSVAPHNDHLDEIAPGFPIGLFSLGATRRMTIRSKAKPRRVLDVDLETGSFLLMSYESQMHYDHGIPKSAAPVGPRMSLALRVRPS